MGVAERKQREFEQREAEILKAALELFDADEWQSVTVEQIAAKAEIGKGTVYTHFCSKEDIYARLTLDFYYGLLAKIEKIDQDQKVIPILKEFISVALRYHIERPEFRRVTQYCKRSDFRQRANEKIRQAFDDLDHRFLVFVDALFNQGMRNREFPTASVKHMHYGSRACFDGAMDTIWIGYNGSEKIDVDEYVEALANFVVAGISGLGHFE